MLAICLTSCLAPGRELLHACAAASDHACSSSRPGATLADRCIWYLINLLSLMLRSAAACTCATGIVLMS